MSKQRRSRLPTSHASHAVGGLHPHRVSESSQVRVSRTLSETPSDASGPIANAARPSQPRQTGAFPLSSNTSLARKACPRCGERYPGDFRVCPRDATELRAAILSDDDPLIGTVLGGDYELLRLIGEGAMGRVYEARHTRLASKKFAIKVLHGDLTRQSEVVERFLREADATSALDHPNIVGVLDVNLVPDGRPYIVAELLQGDQLGAYLDRRRRLRVPEAVDICRQICRALMAAHEKGIVHRDIKPENIFLVSAPQSAGRAGEQRLVKVLDFGISRVNDDNATLTKTGMVLGTPAYMPPEQATGSRVDHRADIYSLGAILYEAVTGNRPFDDTDPIATLAAVLTREPTRPCTINRDLPTALELVIQRAMAKKPEERYQSMEELDAALAPFAVSDASRTIPRLSVAQAPLQQPTRLSLPGIKLPAGMLKAWGNRPGRHIDEARIELVVVSVAAFLCALFALIDASSSVVRLAHGAQTLRGSEIVLTALGSAGLLIAPVLWWVRFLSEGVWARTPRVLATSMSVCRVLFAGLVTFAVSMLLVRVFAGALRADLSGTAWPGWDVLAFIGSVFAVGRSCAHELRSASEQARVSQLPPQR